MWFDTHCHLFDERFQEDLDAVVARARAAGVRHFVVPGVDVQTSEAAIALAERFEGVYAAVGVHPESLADYRPRMLEEIRRLAAHPKVVAIGEIGLDYYWDVAPREVQREVFVAQLDLARETGLPVVVHNRDATEDVVRLIETEAQGVTGVMHCFTGDLDTAMRCIRCGFFISYGGPLTFKNAEAVREAAARIPAEALVVETDSPYLSPHPLRGKRNEPERVRIVGERLAEIRGLTAQEMADLTTRNALRLFTRVRV
ncbi:TatD family hydrolase [Alicyclobacillus sp.]|uniref:TatD family hydrolase n=1 Tax=Alicyclobacillus sp. TaxID=61169 RepID=UPI0025C55B03|nr:TatD family hydrolase [Alicyclobacillus sp.]MCL6516621.1 TatD family hydrolase [Alicyclobacillus sp.]